MWWAAVLMGVMGLVAQAVAGNRGLSPIMMVAQAAVPKAAAQVAKTIMLGGGVVLDYIDPVKGQDWRVADNVCYTLQEEGWFRANGLNAATPKCVVSSIEQSPKHGKLVLQSDGFTYNYRPDPGFIGVDMIVFIVHAEGKNVRVMWPVDVAEHEITYEGQNSQLRNEFQIYTSLGGKMGSGLAFCLHSLPSLSPAS
jgi:hypothetical protein